MILICILLIVFGMLLGLCITDTTAFEICLGLVIVAIVFGALVLITLIIFVFLLIMSPVVIVGVGLFWIVELWKGN